MSQSCPHCSAENRDTAQFCARCAAPLRQVCPQCGADNPSRSRYCAKCGAVLEQAMACSQCGRVNPSGSRFCNDCGAILSPPRATGPRSGQPGVPIYPPTGAGTGMLPPQTILSQRYIIIQCVGRGGMGAVYRASDARIPGKTWAIKEMSDAALIQPLEKQRARANFRQEALMLAQLDHVNLPSVTDHFSEEGKQYLVMDYIEGQTLAERLEGAGGGPLPVHEVLTWARQLCDVLSYLHLQDPPVIFRDLKPDNVMVTPDGTVKLIDFGIARIFKRGKQSDTTYFGTAGYAPREQYGRGQTDARSDVYGLGATLHHLLTGVDPADNPFCFDDLQALNPEVPPHVAQAIQKALADDPADRWPRIEDLRKALEDELPAAVEATQPSRPLSQIHPFPQPAMAGAAATAATQPGRPVRTGRLDVPRGFGLVLLGALLSFGGFWLDRELMDWVGLPVHLLAFIPALFGVLFGPLIGGLAGSLGTLGLILLEHNPWGNLVWAFILADSIPGIAAGLAARDAGRWRSVAGAGIVTSVAWALVTATVAGIVTQYWSPFWAIIKSQFLGTLPTHVILMPLLATWLMKPVSRHGLYWRDRHQT